MNRQTLDKISRLQQRNEDLEQTIGNLVAILLGQNARKGDDGKLEWTGNRALHAACNVAMRMVAKKV